ncbi:MAG: membrane protein insertase YidC [Sedimentisphaerales bacterium]
MNIKKNVFLFIYIPLFICGMVFADGNTPTMTQGIYISASNAEQKTFTLGSVADAKTGNPYKLELELTTKGAAVSKAFLRDYNDRNRKNPRPLELLNGFNNINTMSAARLLLPGIGKAFPLDKLNWQSQGIEEANDVAKISFSAMITKDGGDFIKLTKTYTLKREDYLLNCVMTISNVSDSNVEAGIETTAAAGIEREDERADTRGVVAGFLTDTGTVEAVKTNVKKLAKEQSGKQELFHKNADYKFLWFAETNKYFTTIVRPVPQEANGTSANWLAGKAVIAFDPDGKAESGDENQATFFRTVTFKIAPAGEQKCDFQIYIGPKDRDLFNSTPLYDSLGFIKVIDFQACMGDTFRPLSFFILAAMDWMFGYIGNYGIVIIIFVFIVRVLLHPITKKSQVSMMKMSKLGPMAEEIKQKYAGNKAEMQKKLAGLYREQGATPILGCLPMLLQMPIWIALYSAIYAGIEFRGAAFLPFWITDLSSSDAIFMLPAATAKIPLIGSFIGTSFNLLPLLLGIAMFAQQKLTPSSAPSSNPQAAQQQKMMLWMMPIMMIMFLYRAPSGLNLYIMASTTAGVVEQYVIRKHIREKEAAEQSTLVPTTSKLGGKLKKKKPKPPIKFS